MTERFTEIGKIVNTHGIHGTVKIFPYSDDLSRFFDLKRVFLGVERIPLYPKQVNIRKNMVYMSFEGYESINEVLYFKNKLIYILAKERMPLRNNQYYITDLIGLKVIGVSGENFGKIQDVIQGPANDIFIISRDSSSWMLPAVKEFIHSVDIEENIMIIDPIEGMVE